MKNSHALFSPSSSCRWLECPLSLKLEQEIKIETKESEQSRAGTEAHKKLEQLITTYYNSDLFNNDSIIDISDPYINSTFKQIITRYPKKEYKILPEASLYYTPDIHGTCDMLVFRWKECYPVGVLDFKYGDTEVPVIGNTQLLMYAYIVSKLFGKIEKGLTLGIYQPKCENSESLWTVYQDMIDMFEIRVKEAMDFYYGKETKHKGYPAKQTEAVCKYCPVRYTTCPYTSNAVQVLNNDIVLNEGIDSLQIKKEHEIFLLKHRTKIIGYLDDLHARYKLRLQNGEQIEGLKLTKDKEIKKWKDENEARKIMELNGINPYTVKLKTPSQVIKETKDKILGIESFIDIEKKGSYIVED